MRLDLHKTVFALEKMLFEVSGQNAVSHSFLHLLILTDIITLHPTSTVAC